MIYLFFGDLFSVLTTLFVFGMLAFIILSMLHRHRIEEWGRRILAFIMVGTAVSAFSAMRDGFMAESAVFSASGIQAIVCSILGGLIFLTGIIALFIRNQGFRKFGFQMISVLFLIQVITIEASRIAFNLGGTL